MKVGRGRHPRVWFAAAPPGGPGATPSATTGPAPVPGPWDARAGKARGAPGHARSFSRRLLWRATPPHLWGNGKRDGQTASPTKAGPLKLGCLTTDYDAICARLRRSALRIALPSSCTAARGRGEMRKHLFELAHTFSQFAWLVRHNDRSEFVDLNQSP